MRGVEEVWGTGTRKQAKTDLTPEDRLYRAGLILLAAGLVCLPVLTKRILPGLPEVDCVYQRMWGIYCPGCGGTRAVTALLQGHLLKSLWYHPIVLYAAVMYGCFMLSHTLKRIHVSLVRGMRLRIGYLYGALAIILVNCLVKNILRIRFGILME